MKENKEKQLFDIATTQQGYFTSKQAITAGFSYRLQHYYKQREMWEEIERGVFRLVRYPQSPEEDFVRVSLWSRDRADIPQAVLSYETALSVHGMSDVMPSKIHITVPQKFRKKVLKGCVLHKAEITQKEKEQRDGYFVTTPLRTIIDVAESDISIDYFEQAVREACDKGLVRVIDIAAAPMSDKARKRAEFVFNKMKD